MGPESVLQISRLSAYQNISLIPIAPPHILDCLIKDQVRSQGRVEKAWGYTKSLVMILERGLIKKYFCDDTRLAKKNYSFG